MESQSQNDSLGVVSPGDIPKSQVVSTGHSMETGKAGAIGLSEDQKGVVIPGDIPNSQVVSTGHSMETGKAGAIGLSEDQPIHLSSNEQELSQLSQELSTNASLTWDDVLVAFNRKKSSALSTQTINEVFAEPKGLPLLPGGQSGQFKEKLQNMR